MTMVTLTSSSNSNLLQPLSSENNRNNLREASFSSYLNGAEESFVLRLAADSSQKLISPIFPTTPPNDHHGFFNGKKKTAAGDGEIGVFDAVKYFNGGIDDDDNDDEETTRKSTKKSPEKSESMWLQHKVDEPVFLDHPIKPKIGTPSVRSESSWNSQSKLLDRNSARTSKTDKKGNGKRFLASLGCKCSCADKDSVAIDEIHTNVGVSISKQQSIKTGIINPVDVSPPNSKIPNPRPQLWVKEEEMLMNQQHKMGNMGILKMPSLQEENEEKLRKSMEVFGSPIWENRNKKLSKLNWDEPNSRAEMEIDIPSTETDDIESDASSDLFEIESLTGRVNPFLTRQALGGMSGGCVTPTTTTASCYAPSEASIAWSVVTASAAADFSAMSDFEEYRPPAPAASGSSKRAVGNLAAAAKTAMNKEFPRRRPGILLGCKSHKAVRVAGDAYNKKTNETKATETAAVAAGTVSDLRMGNHRAGPEHFMPVTRFQAEAAKVTGFGSRHEGQRAFAPRSQGSSICCTSNNVFDVPPKMQY